MEKDRCVKKYQAIKVKGTYKSERPKKILPEVMNVDLRRLNCMEETKDCDKW